MTTEDHVKFLETCKSTGCKFAISGYPSELYRDMLSDWRVVEWKQHLGMSMVGLHQSTDTKKWRPERIECLWMNYKYSPGSDQGML